MSKGFTLIELILVIVILAILAGAIIPVINTSRADARAAKIDADLESIKSAAYMYRSDTGNWPAAMATLSTTSGVAPAGYIDRAAPTNPCGDAYTTNGTVITSPVNTAGGCVADNLTIHL